MSEGEKEGFYRQNGFSSQGIRLLREKVERGGDNKRERD